MNKFKIIQAVETLTFLIVILSMIWLLFDFVKAFLNDDLQFNSITAYGISVILVLIVFVLPPIWHILVEKSKKKNKK